MADPPEPFDPESLPLVDWRLGQTDKTTAGCLWLIIGVVAAVAIVPLGGLLTMLRGWTPEKVLPTELFTASYFYFLGAVWSVIAMVRYFNPGKLGWWGRLTHRLMKALPHAKAKLRAPTTVLPGVRLRVRRKAVVLFAPLRIVLVSRGWNPWVLTGGLAMATLMLVVAGPKVFVTQSYWFANALVVFGLGRRIAVQSVACIEIEETALKDGALIVTVMRGPLNPRFELSCPKGADTEDLRDRIESARVDAAARDSGVDRELAHLEQTHADD